MGSITGPLATELAMNVAKNRASMPPEVVKSLDKDSANLRATYALEPLGVGAVAPNFTLLNATKTPTSLSSLLKEHKAVVLTWYRGAWCPYCNIALHALGKIVPELEKLGAKLVALTPETPDESMTFKEKRELKFEVLSDDGCEVALKYGAAFKVSDRLKEILGGMSIEFDSINGNSENRKASLPVPATFVLDKDGKIVYSFFNLDYTKRAEPSDILTAVRKTVSWEYQLLGKANTERGARFSLSISDESLSVDAKLIFTFPRSYPQQLANIVLHSTSGIPTSQGEELVAYLKKEARGMLNEPMVFALHGLAKEWLVDHMKKGVNDNDGEEGKNVMIGMGQVEDEGNFETRDEEARQTVEMVRSKVIGTPVTVDSFMAWREKFMKEFGYQLSGKEVDDEALAEKLTGREIFEQGDNVIDEHNEEFWNEQAELFQE